MPPLNKVGNLKFNAGRVYFPTLNSNQSGGGIIGSNTLKHFGNYVQSHMDIGGDRAISVYGDNLHGVIFFLFVFVLWTII